MECHDISFQIRVEKYAVIEPIDGIIITWATIYKYLMVSNSKIPIHEVLGFTILNRQKEDPNWWKIKVTVLVLNLFITCYSKLITITAYILTWFCRLASPSWNYNWIEILSKDYRASKYRGYTIQFSSFYRATDISMISWHLEKGKSKA
jgi:hypothetical protein